MNDMEFMHAWQRMCSRQEDCSVCDAEDVCDDIIFPSLYNEDFIKKLINIVHNWTDAHPIKTRQSKFMEEFPNALQSNDLITINPCVLDQELKKNCKSQNCEKCRKEYWLLEVE